MPDGVRHRPRGGVNMYAKLVLSIDFPDEGSAQEFLEWFENASGIPGSPEGFDVHALDLVE